MKFLALASKNLNAVHTLVLSLDPLRNLPDHGKIEAVQDHGMEYLGSQREDSVISV